MARLINIRQSTVLPLCHTISATLHIFIVILLHRPIYRAPFSCAEPRSRWEIPRPDRMLYCALNLDRAIGCALWLRPHLCAPASEGGDPHNTTAKSLC